MKKSNSKESPLDKAIINKDLKIIELIITKLLLMKDYKISHMFHDSFVELLSIDLPCFHSYLSECFFQTIQMQDVRYIDVKLEDGFWMTHHHSCLIDDNFINKYTNKVEQLDDIKLQNSKKLEKGKSKLKVREIY